MSKNILSTVNPLERAITSLQMTPIININENCPIEKVNNASMDEISNDISMEDNNFWTKNSMIY